MYSALRAAMVVVLLLLAGGGAGARTVLDLDAARQPVALADWGDYWVDTTGSATLQQVLRLGADAQRPTLARGIYPLKPGQVLWIRFSVPAAPDAERWYLKLPNAGLDRVTLYTRQERGWSQQSAGDRVAVADWPLPHLYPILPLAVSAADASYYALRIEASNSFSTPLQFVEWLIRWKTAEGTWMRLEEVAAQRWSGDRIVEERFYYEGVIDEGRDDD